MGVKWPVLETDHLSQSSVDYVAVHICCDTLLLLTQGFQSLIGSFSMCFSLAEEGGEHQYMATLSAPDETVDQ
jgi:hypothetical protein